MKQLLLICAVVALVGCGESKEEKAAKAKAIAEARAAAEAKAAEANATVTPKPEPPKAVPANIADPIVEEAIREILKKPTGELTDADLEKVTRLPLKSIQLTEVPKGLENLTQLTHLSLFNNQLTDVKGLEKLTKLTDLNLYGNQLTDVKGLEKLTKLTYLNLGFNLDLTKAQIDALQKALPKCEIDSNPTK